MLAAPVASAAQCLYHVVKWLSAQTTFPAESMRLTPPQRRQPWASRGVVMNTTPDDSLINRFWSPPAFSLSCLQGRIVKALQQAKFLRLYETATTTREKARLLSASGPGNGACFADPPSDPKFWLLDFDFTCSSYYRLGVDVPSRSGRCQHYSAAIRTDATIAPICNADLVRSPDHFLMCKKGGCINRIHKAVANLLAVFCKEAGFDTRLEVVIPEFVRQAPLRLPKATWPQLQRVHSNGAGHPRCSCIPPV